MHRFAGDRVFKPQHPGVKALPVQPLDAVPRAIDAVARQRVADAGHVHPDLMGTARLQAAGNVCKAVILCKYLIAGIGVLSIRDHRHFLRSVRWRPMGASTKPSGSLKRP